MRKGIKKQNMNTKYEKNGISAHNYIRCLSVI
jgi:hypothetical protein